MRKTDMNRPDRPPTLPHPTVNALSTLLVLLAAVAGAAAGAQTPAPFVEPEVTVLTTLTAESPGDSFGWVAEAVGDLDGDGASEYVIGAIRNAEGGTVAGKAYVYSGRDGSLLRTFVGNPFERLGFAVTGGRDVDADGVSDYALGAPAVAGQPTRVLVVSGADHSLIHELHEAPGTGYGFDLGMVADANGDGHADLVVGAPFAAGFAGRVDLVSGADGSLLWSRTGLPGELLGTAVTGLADLNGDGIPEAAAGAVGGGQPTGPGGSTTGTAYVLDGSTGAVLRQLSPNGGALQFGLFFIHDAGDTDADGTPDIYVSDFSDPKGGRGYVFSGASGERLRLINAETPADGLGMARGAGDVDGDGHADLVIGAFLSSAGNFQAGKCTLVSGKNGQVLRTFTATLNNAQIGFDVVTLGDVDGDGWTDFLLTGLDVAYVVAGRAP